MEMTPDQNEARCAALADGLKTLLGARGCPFAFDDSYTETAKALLHKMDAAAPVLTDDGALVLIGRLILALREVAPDHQLARQNTQLFR